MSYILLCWPRALCATVKRPGRAFGWFGTGCIPCTATRGFSCTSRQARKRAALQDQQGRYAASTVRHGEPDNGRDLPSRASPMITRAGHGRRHHTGVLVDGARWSLGRRVQRELFPWPKPFLAVASLQNSRTACGVIPSLTKASEGAHTRPRGAASATQGGQHGKHRQLYPRR